MPMSKFSTLNYLISSYHAVNKKFEQFQFPFGNSEDYSLDLDQIEFEPSAKSIDAILNFASQYEVLQSKTNGDIELSLN